MKVSTIADYLKYANLQMAAEAFLVDRDNSVTDDIAGVLRPNEY